jgi:hypothetical protein
VERIGTTQADDSPANHDDRPGRSGSHSPHAVKPFEAELRQLRGLSTAPANAPGDPVAAFAQARG